MGYVETFAIDMLRVTKGAILQVQRLNEIGNRACDACMFGVHDGAVPASEGLAALGYVRLCEDLEVAWREAGFAHVALLGWLCLNDVHETDAFCKYLAITHDAPHVRNLRANMLEVADNLQKAIDGVTEWRAWAIELRDIFLHDETAVPS